MPGANYMGGRRNAAKAKAKDAPGRLEKTFFGQRRLCALSKGLLASKPMQRCNVPLEESMGLADISLGHAKRKIPKNNDASTSSFVPSPIHISPSTPRSRRRTKQRLEAHSSSSNISRSKVLDALDVSEPMFLRGVLDKILTMPDLAGISKNRPKPTVATGRQPQASDGSSPLQRTKRKRSPSYLYEESDSLNNERPSSPSRYVQSYAYEGICTPLQKKRTGSDHKIVDEEQTRTLLVEDNISLYSENTSSYYRDDYNMELTGIDADECEFSAVVDDVQGDVRSSPWSPQYSPSLKHPSSNYTPYSPLDSEEIMNLNDVDSYTSLPTSIVFRGLKDGSRHTETATHSVEEPTVYGTLFEQADPWDAIGQILGLSSERGSMEKAICNEEYKSILDIPELKEGDGLFMGPSLFDDLDEDEEDDWN